MCFYKVRQAKNIGVCKIYKDNDLVNMKIYMLNFWKSYILCHSLILELLVNVTNLFT